MERSEQLAIEILKEIENVKAIIKDSVVTCDRILDSMHRTEESIIRISNSMENLQESIRKINETVLKIGNKLN